MLRYWKATTILLVAVVMAACGAQAEPDTATTDEQAETDSAAPAAQQRDFVSATGEVIPDLYTQLSFATGGELTEINVEVGDTVEAGDVIAELDTRDLEAAVRGAEAALASAEAQLAQVETGPSEEQIAAAQSSLDAARARIGAAVANRDALYSAITEDQIAAAEDELISAQLLRDDISQSLEDLINWADNADLSQFEPGDPNPLAAGEGLAYNLELAELQLAGAQARLEDLLDGPDPEQLQIQNARIGLASAQAEAAEARLNLLEAQPFAEDVAIAEAQVVQAEADVAAAEAQLEQAILVAPFGGTVVDVLVDPNEFVGPGQQIVQIGDLSGLQIETTDLNELDVASIDVGNEVIITFDALPGVETEGVVTSIAPKSQQGTGVNFTVTIEMTDTPDQVRWGMTAFVDIRTNE